ncbi:pectin lyase-like protein [Xylariaceae sp. FL0662B]|nr:pectin lyase-like protein [Xylariaceae sp. FL0662B]
MLLSVLLFVTAILASITTHDHDDPLFVGATLPAGPPQPVPSYAKNNINNQFGTAPDKGLLDGPVLGPLNSDFLHDLHRHSPSLLEISQNSSQGEPKSGLVDDDYWLARLGPKGQMPFAPPGYQFFRNVRDFGAVGDGVTDDTAAINRAAASMSQDNLGETRCAADCGSTTTLGALVYFPPGTYLISSPIVQYYYTQFVGSPLDRPVIKGSTNFTGIALVDNNMYIPGGSGRQWYINQSNFLRQIRNFIFDMTEMANENWQGDQRYVPTGVHWQVGQATSINNCVFNMTRADQPGGTTAIGIMMENGSGGVVDYVEFRGGNVGFFAGSQQFTATNLAFVSCNTAIKHPWNWGFLWKDIYVYSCSVAFDCTDYSAETHQNTGSITVLDSFFDNTPEGIIVPSDPENQPNIVLDNLYVINSRVVVQAQGGDTILAGSSDEVNFGLWATGYQYAPISGSGGAGSNRTGFIIPTVDKPETLLVNGRYLTRPKPDYTGFEEYIIIDATEHGVKNDATGDQTEAINTLLSENIGSIIFFPGGIYVVESTVEVPVGSYIVGSGWSQIMGTGSYFADENNPQVMVQVGKEGDVGTLEISDMMFTVKAPSAGCILMEWNVHEASQGYAALFDSHFRVGGATGSNLQAAECPAFTTSVDRECMAATMLMHITKNASAYVHNAWLWVSDHDLDNPGNSEAYESDEGVPVNANMTQISVYAGRGMLVESQGPVWLYGVSSEHAQMYQFALHGASNIYMGHIQTETPYYQPNPSALEPYSAGVDGRFQSDPTFNDCYDDRCRGAWALRIINSTNIVVYSAGFYSFFQDNDVGCTDTESCQLALVETSFSERLWVFNLFTKGNIEIISPKGIDLLLPVLFNDTTRRGYTSETAAWLVLSVEGGNQGIDPQASANDGSGPVRIDPGIWQSPDEPVTINCQPPCTYVLPPVTLSTLTTITFPPSPTSLMVGWSTSTFFIGDDGSETSTTDYSSTLVDTTLTIPPITTSIIPMANVPVPSGVDSTLIYPSWSLDPPPFVITDDPDLEGPGITHPPNTRTITPKPWTWGMSTIPTIPTFPTSPSESTSTSPMVPPLIVITHTTGSPGPMCTGGCGQLCGSRDQEKCVITAAIVGDPCAKPEVDARGHSANAVVPVTGVYANTAATAKARCTTGEDFIDSNDPERQVPDPDECTTRTYSSCRTACTASPAQGCTSTCSNVIGCDTSGATFASTITPAPVFDPGFLDTWTGVSDFQAQLSAAQGAISRLSSEGDFGTMGNPPPPPSPSPPPSPTPSTSSAPYYPTVGPPKEPTAYLEISEHSVEGGDCSWWFWASPAGQVIDFCNYDDSIVQYSFDCGTTFFPLPNGSFVVPTLLDQKECWVQCFWDETASSGGR